MSDRPGLVGTLVKAKNKTGQEFLSIMGKDGKSVSDNKKAGAEKKRLETAMSALSPWYDKAKVFGSGKVKTEGALQWPSEAHKDFSTRMEKVETAKKAKNFTTAADLAEQAKLFAEATDRTKAARQELADAFKETARLLSGVRPSPDDLKKKLAAEIDEDRRGSDPGEILKRVRQLKVEAEKLASSGTGQTYTEGPKRGDDFYKVDLTQTDNDKEKQRRDEAGQKFSKDYEAVEKALARLVDMVAPTVPPLAGKVASSKQRVIEAGTFDDGASTITELLKEIETAQQQAQNAAKVAGGQLATEIATLRTDLTKQSKAAGVRTKPAYDALLEELGQLDVIVKTNNVAAFATATEQVKAIRATGVTSAPAVARLNETANAVELAIADKVVKKEFQSESSDIGLALKTLVAGFSLEELAAAQKSLAGLNRDAGKLKLRAEGLGPWRKDMGSRLETLAGMIKEFHKLMPKVKDTTFEQNYTQAKATYDKPGVDRAAVDKLVRDAMNLAYPIINNLHEAGPGHLKTINALEADRKVGAAALQDKETKDRNAKAEVKELEDDLKLLKADLKTATDVVNSAPHGDKEELGELKELAGQAQKKFDAKPQDLKGARSQFKAVRKRLDALLQTPGGVTAGSVKELAQVETLWNAAMDETRGLLEKIASDAGPAAEAARLKPADVKARTDGLYKRFEPFKATLVRSIKVLADETTELKTRKAERELALRDVRAIRGMIEGDAVAAKLAANPFGVAPPFTKLRRFLNDMEYNALRAVPPE